MPFRHKSGADAAQMAKGGVNIEQQTREIIRDVRSGVFAPVYLLMGEEPFYPDMVCDAIVENAVEPESRDFDQFVFYGSDSDADAVITAARGFSMFGGRVLVVLKEAQLFKDSELEKLALYCSQPLDSTVLVVYLHGASADKRKSFYKSVQKIGVVVDSPAVRDYEIAQWIQRYYQGRGLEIDPQAAALLGEYAGTDLCKIAVETDKLLKNLPEGTVSVGVGDIERNVGISRQYSVFELTKELSYRNSAAAVRIASGLAQSARFVIPPAVSALYTHFYRILKYEALLIKGMPLSNEDKAKALGVNPYFFREYDVAVRNYPLPKVMAIISLLNDYDFKGKGGDVGADTPPDEIFVELIVKILNI